MQLSNQFKNAIVTGASRGLGREFSKMLLAEGIEVWGTARDAKSIPIHDSMHACSLDLTDTLSIANFLNKIVEECPSVDLLINNAGYGVYSPFETFPVGDITRQIEVMLTGPIRLCRVFYPQMLKRGTGTIVNVASLAAEFPLPMMPLYNASKAGLSRFTKTLELEAKGSGIHIIDFQPGDYKTGFNDSVVHQKLQANSREGRVWSVLEKHLQSAPPAYRSAEDLRRALLKQKSGLVTSGSFFQARLAPFLARFVAWSVVCPVIRNYYKM